MANVISRVLVANRGEIARRVFRTCREMGLATVAVYSDPDRDSLHVADADVAVPIGGATAQQSYLDIAKLVAAARRTGADAVHPGYGFLAENADFARACLDAGLVWIGPRPETMAAMGRKVEAKRLAAAAGVPLLPGATVDGDDPAAWRATAAGVGFPLLVKASAGGGGKGMRRVEGPDALEDAVGAGRREAASSFGDPTVFLERFLPESRHVEVQVLADRHGGVVHLFERDCSLQRRHQKVVEEAPAPRLAPALRRGMHDAAVALTRSIGYENAGTIEFLVDDDAFFFLEMNTRLQVEHPVTEAITGLDLVRLQIAIAEGAPLPFTQDDVRTTGHAVEVRLYAEDPRRDHLPSVGTVEAFRPAPSPVVRWETGVRAGSPVTAHYDPLLAKVVAAAPTREAAARVLGLALRGLDVAGVATNRDMLVATLEHRAFTAGDVSTAFFELHPDVLTAGAPVAAVRHLVIGLALVLRETDRPSGAPAGIPAGWRNLAAVDQRWSFTVDGARVDVALPPPGGAPGSAVVDGHGVGFEVVGMEAPEVDLVVDGLRATLRVDSRRDRHTVTGLGWQIDAVEVPRLGRARPVSAGAGPSAPLPGTVVAVEVRAGDVVAEGQLLVVVEAMKMEHRVVADTAGTVSEVLVAVGDTVQAHQLLVAIASEPT